MDGLKLTGIPATVEHVVETLIEFYAEFIPEILKMSIEEFVASTHYRVGLFIGNSWYLWWCEGHQYDSWPREKPALVKYFNDLGVESPELMSSFLMIYFYQKVHNQ